MNTSFRASGPTPYYTRPHGRPDLTTGQQGAIIGQPKPRVNTSTQPSPGGYLARLLKFAGIALAGWVVLTAWQEITTTAHARVNVPGLTAAEMAAQAEILAVTEATGP